MRTRELEQVFRQIESTGDGAEQARHTQHIYRRTCKLSHTYILTHTYSHIHTHT